MITGKFLLDSSPRRVAIYLERRCPDIEISIKRRKTVNMAVGETLYGVQQYGIEIDQHHLSQRTEGSTQLVDPESKGSDDKTSPSMGCTSFFR